MLIVAPWKFDVLKTSIFTLEANICFKDIQISRDNYQPIVPRQKHSIVQIVPSRLICVNNIIVKKRVQQQKQLTKAIQNFSQLLGKILRSMACRSREATLPHLH